MMDPHLAHLSSNDAPFWLIGKRERKRERKIKMMAPGAYKTHFGSSS